MNDKILKILTVLRLANCILELRLFLVERTVLWIGYVSKYEYFVLWITLCDKIYSQFLY